MRNNSFKNELFITFCFVSQAKYWIDAIKKVHCKTDCLFLMSAYRHDRKLKCVILRRFNTFYHVPVQIVEVAEIQKTKKREELQYCNTHCVIVSAVFITICFQKHHVCLLSSPFVCCQVSSRYQRVSCDRAYSIYNHLRSLSINQSLVLQITFYSPWKPQEYQNSRRLPLISLLSQSLVLFFSQECQFFRPREQTIEVSRTFLYTFEEENTHSRAKSGSESFKVDGTMLPGRVQWLSVKESTRISTYAARTRVCCQVN